MQPPLWFKLLLFAAAGLCLFIAGRKLVQDDLYISRSEQWSISLILATVEGVVVGVVSSMQLLSLGFLGDVAVGLSVGFIGVELLRRLLRPLADMWLDVPTQLFAVWGFHATFAVFLPTLASLGEIQFPAGFDIGIGGVAVCMIVWTLGQEFGPGDTLAETLRET